MDDDHVRVDDNLSPMPVSYNRDDLVPFPPLCHWRVNVHVRANGSTHAAPADKPQHCGSGAPMRQTRVS
ncbi:uncharacterized protein FOMMEDRAFT_153952 [Fomitiporia mediterranea MF3/22]|uniref:uncharacterized protein n=1 Tax=Fomitiporia mediterranea (strain MF3/22) TaxID=694068 RepID=UPI0004408C07|nr:uncharacterized protein FOMMEDRAFT_153952 [Fomitiporia mediterranea MF3/22]EJD04826.1 hypothetical protein FOMMEDRAFT_153952 [Fomitiporia mediterranea MF3/22]